jgi:hypothetical protein
MRAVAGVSLVAWAAAGLLAGGCVDPASGAQASCAAQGVGELRCRAIVNEAGTRLPSSAVPLLGAEVILAVPADRDTLREQQLIATVRFSFVDGSATDVPVFCPPRLADTLICADPSR